MNGCEYEVWSETQTIRRCEASFRQYSDAEKFALEKAKGTSDRASGPLGVTWAVEWRSRVEFRDGVPYQTGGFQIMRER